MKQQLKKIWSNTKAVSSGFVEKVTGGLIGITVLFLLAATLIPEAQTAGNTLNSSGAPLGSLFAGSGVVFVIIMASIVLAVLGGFALSRRNKR